MSDLQGYELYPIGELSMKLLIVDDEELTRTGRISSIDWDWPDFINPRSFSVMCGCHE